MTLATNWLLRIFRTGVFCAATLIVVMPVRAADVDTSKWRCNRCPFQDGMTGSVAAGARVVSDAENTFGNYTGYAESAIDVVIGTNHGDLAAAAGVALAYH